MFCERRTRFSCETVRRCRGRRPGSCGLRPTRVSEKSSAPPPACMWPRPSPPASILRESMRCTSHFCRVSEPMIVSKPIPRAPYDVCIVHLADARYYPFFHRQASALAEKGYRVALVSWERQARPGRSRMAGNRRVSDHHSGKSHHAGKFFFVRYFFSLAIVLLRLKARLYEAVDPPALVPARIAAGIPPGRGTIISPSNISRAWTSSWASP